MAEKRPKMGQKSPHGQPHGGADQGCPSVLTYPVQPPRCSASVPTELQRAVEIRVAFRAPRLRFFRWGPETHVTVGRFSRFSRFCNACQPMCNAWPTPHGHVTNQPLTPPFVHPGRFVATLGCSKGAHDTTPMDERCQPPFWWLGTNYPRCNACNGHVTVM